VVTLRALLSRLGAGLPAAFWWLWGGALVSALATFVFPFLALFLRSRGFSPEGTGLVVSLFGAGNILAGPAAGHLADRVGRRPTMLGALLFSAALTALLGALRSPASLAAAVLALGLTANAYRPAASAAIADLVPAAGRPRAFGLLYWANNLGVGVSFAAGGLLAASGWGPLFLADAATTLLFALLVWRRVPETRPAAGPAARDGAPGFGAVLGDRVFLAFLGLHLLLLLVFLQFMVAAPLDMAQKGLSTATYGRVLSVNGLLIVALQPGLTRLAGRRDPSRVLALSAALVGLGFGAYGLARSAWQLAAATAVWTLGEILMAPVGATVVAALAPAALRGRYQGLFSLSWGLGMLLAPLLGAAALARAGAPALWAACLGLALVVALGHLAAAGARRRRMAERAREEAG